MLSIVVGTYNRLDQIKACIDSIRAETRTPFRIYVTDAGSTDGTIEYLTSQADSTLEPVFVGQKLGQARAYNDVFKRVTTPYVCWLSDDNVVVDRGLDRAVEILEADRRIGLVGLKTQDQRGPFKKSPYIGGLSTIGILNVNQGLLPTPVMNKIGGFSEAFRDYGIDPDLTAKVLFSGYDIVYTRNVALHHYRNWSEDPQSAEFAWITKRNEAAKALYTEKYGALARNAWIWKGRRAAWWAFRKAMGKRFSLNGRSAFMGQLPRDWHNLIAGRYISPFEAMGAQTGLYHLRQHCPRYAVPKTLPEDPSPQMAVSSTTS